MEAERFAALVGRIRSDLGSRDAWVVPKLYRDSSALAVVDSIQSIGVRYGSVERVLGAYRAFRRERDGDPNTDGLASLVATFEELGGPEEWATHIGTKHLTSTRNGTLKAKVILEAAEVLRSEGIDSAEDFRSALGDREAKLKEVWVRLPGQRSGISWGYVTALVGAPSVKPDRMIVRYLSTATGSELSPTDAGLLLKRVAGELGEEPFLVDHNLWRLQSGRSSGP